MNGTVSFENRFFRTLGMVADSFRDFLLLTQSQLRASQKPAKIIMLCY